MNKINISDALIAIWDLIEGLETGYWEASSMDAKDQLFNLLQVLQREYIELLKLSVQDHHFEYEVISLPPQQLHDLMINLQRDVTRHCPRNSTRQQLATLADTLLTGLTD
tara:strand:- start:24952 stop:25281 length:330 start_codon:yes stop_codon:yes gene_type:complete